MTSSTVQLKISGLTANNVSAIMETAEQLRAQPGIVSIATTATTAVFEVSEPRDAAQAVANVAANLPGRGHPRASLHSVRRKLETAAMSAEPVPAAEPEPTEPAPSTGIDHVFSQTAFNETQCSVCLGLWIRNAPADPAEALDGSWPTECPGSPRVHGRRDQYSPEHPDATGCNCLACQLPQPAPARPAAEPTRVRGIHSGEVYRVTERAHDMITLENETTGGTSRVRPDRFFQCFTSVGLTAPELTDWEAALMGYGVTAEPSSWVLETSNDNAPEPDDAPEPPQSAPLIVSVSNTLGLVNALMSAGFVVAPRCFPDDSGNLTYLTAERPGSYLTFRAPNAGEIPAPAAAPARSLDDPDRLDAEAYRYLRDQISATMTGPDVWDTDDSESYILAEYVKWLAAGQPVDEDGYPDRSADARPHQPNTRAALRLAAEAIEAAGEQLDNPSSFGPSARTILSQVHNTLLEIRAALTGPAGAVAAEPEPEPVRVGYPVRVRPAEPGDSVHAGRGRYQGSTGIVMRRGSDGWAGEGQPGTERFGVRLDYSASSPDGGQIVYFRATDLVVIGEVSQNNADPYPCANCHGRGRSQLAPLDPCIRCGGTGSDPYVNRGLSDRAMRALTEAGAADLIDREKSHVLPADLADETAADMAEYTDALAAAFPNVPEPCKYSAAHLAAEVPAVTVLDCGPAGRIPACRECADLYQRLS